MTGALPFDPLLLAYAVPLVFLWAGTIWLSRRRTAHSLRVLEEAKVAGLSEPATLHPVIDPSLCLGCGACVAACPEKLILGLIDGKAKLIEPSQCIGHGACAASCPTDAIKLVFGTETRGVDIPFVSPKFETNVPGIYIAGELGGMGLIRNAIEQGRQAIGNIAAKVKALPRRRWPARCSHHWRRAGRDCRQPWSEGTQAQSSTPWSRILLAEPWRTFHVARL